MIADVARRHDLAPQQLSNWIRAAKEGQFALPADETPAFVPVVPVESAQPSKAAHEHRSAAIEIVIGTIKVPLARSLPVPSGVVALAWVESFTLGLMATWEITINCRDGSRLRLSERRDHPPMKGDVFDTADTGQTVKARIDAYCIERPGGSRPPFFQVTATEI